MKLRNLIVSVALLTTGAAFAATGVYESYGVLKINTSAVNTYFDMQASTANPDFQGANLGTFDTTVGNTLLLSGGEIKTWKNGLSNVTGGKFAYQVYLTGNTPGSFAELGLNWVADLGGGDQKWDKTNADVNLLSGLGDGNYTLEVFAYSTTAGDGPQYSNNGGANYKASFTVVPEATSAALGLIGAALLLRRRR